MGHIHHNVSALVPLGRVVSMGDYAIDRDLAKLVTAQEAQESFDNAVAATAVAFVRSALRHLSLDDLIGGLHSATQQKDGAPLKAAFLAGDTQFGAACRALVHRAINEEMGLKAHESVTQAHEMLGYD